MSLNELEGWPRRVVVAAAGVAILGAGVPLWRHLFPGYQRGWIPNGQSPFLQGNEIMAQQMAAHAKGTDFYLSTLTPPDRAEAPRMATQFKRVRSARIRDNAIVLGVSHGGESKAYEVGWIFSLQVINDVVGGQPVLVSG